MSVLVRRRHVSLTGVVWIVIGMIVAANHHFLSRLDSLSRILSAVLAVGVWPLVVLKVHFGI
jgi:hypothetical protein